MSIFKHLYNIVHRPRYILTWYGEESYIVGVFSSRRKVEAFIASHPADGGAYDWGIWYMDDPMRDPDISLYV